MSLFGPIEDLINETINVTANTINRGVNDVKHIIDNVTKEAETNVKNIEHQIESGISDILNPVLDSAGNFVRTAQSIVAKEIEDAELAVKSITGIDVGTDIQNAINGINVFIDSHKDSVITVGEDLLSVGLVSIGVPVPLAHALSTLAGDAIVNGGRVDAETVGSVLGSALGGPLAKTFSANVVQSFETGKINLAQYAATAAGAVTPELEAKLTSQLTNGIESVLGTHVGAAVADALSSISLNALHQVKETGKIDVSALAREVAQHEIAGAKNVLNRATADAQQWAREKISAITTDVDKKFGSTVDQYVATATKFAKDAEKLLTLEKRAKNLAQQVVASPGLITANIITNRVNNIILSGRASLTSTGAPLAPFASLVVTDPSPASPVAATISVYRDQAETNAAGIHYGAIDGSVGKLSEAGLTETAPGVYTLSAASSEALTAALHGLNFTPSGVTGNTSSTLVDLTMAVADTTGHVAPNQSAAFLTFIPLSVDSEVGGKLQNVAVHDNTTGTDLPDTSSAYTGPVSGVSSQFMDITADNLNVTAKADNLFVATGTGNDAIALHGGINVVDAGSGSNFLTGAAGFDTFFLDARNIPAQTSAAGPVPGAIWDTLEQFGAGGDAVTLWGVGRAAALSWQTNQGAVGHTGLTLHANKANGTEASITFAGIDSRASLSLSYGNSGGVDYLYVKSV